ncbi:MAG: response regulator [Cypionkella sp.]|nr:response regulator [Cypionkella sp.]
MASLTRSESEANRKFEGTGLGLAITQRLIERMEGAVWVDSELGKGSCFGFRVTLPVAEDALPTRVPTQIERVLVVDDQFINRTILERQLAPCGIAVTLARSGADALAALQAGNFDAILTDYEMPEMNGMQLACAVRAAGVDAPIILLTSNPAASRTDEGHHHLSATLQKPILRADLATRESCRTPSGEEVVAAVAPPPPPAAARKMRVLVAEDNRTNQLVFQKMVREAQIDLHFAGNGVEAVAQFQSLAPDLILWRTFHAPKKLMARRRPRHSHSRRAGVACADCRANRPCDGRGRDCDFGIWNRPLYDKTAAQGADFGHNYGHGS